MIVAENLTKYYGLKPAVQNVSFRIEKGEIVGFLGPNGAGKTTILRILTGFFQPTSGKILVDGLNGRTHSLEVRRKIGMACLVAGMSYIAVSDDFFIALPVTFGQRG